MEKEILMRSMEHAAELADGYDELARRLGVSTQDVISWSHGQTTPSTMMFLLVLDFIITETRRLSSAAMAFGLAEQVVAKARNDSRAR